MPIETQVYFGMADEFPDGSHCGHAENGSVDQEFV